MKKILLTSLLAFTLAAPAIHGAVYVSSTFTDSDLGQNGRKQIVTTKGSNFTPWYLYNSNASAGNTNFVVVDDAAAGGLGKAATLKGNIVTGTSFDATELKIGETLTISFDYRFLTAPAAGTEYLRIMLYNSGSSVIPTADNNGIDGSTNYTGYFFGLGVGSTNLAAQTTIKKRNSGSGSIATAALSGMASSRDGIVSGTTAHSVVLTLTRNETSNFLKIVMDGETVASATDTSETYNLFNSLIINNQSGSGVNVNLDNIVLSVIPEPGTVSLSILGVGALCYGVMRAKVAQTK